MSNTKQDSKVRVRINHGVRIRTGVKSGGWSLNHGVRVRTGVKAGDIKWNHGVRVRTGVKAGGLRLNHGAGVRTTTKQKLKSSEIQALRVKTSVKAGDGYPAANHGYRMRTGVKAGGFRMNHGMRVRHASR